MSVLFTVTVEPAKSAQPVTVIRAAPLLVAEITVESVPLVIVKLPVTATGEPSITRAGNVTEPLMTHTASIHTAVGGGWPMHRAGVGVSVVAGGAVVDAAVDDAGMSVVGAGVSVVGAGVSVVGEGVVGAGVVGGGVGESGEGMTSIGRKYVEPSSPPPKTASPATRPLQKDVSGPFSVFLLSLDAPCK